MPGLEVVCLFWSLLYIIFGSCFFVLIVGRCTYNFMVVISIINRGYCMYFKYILYILNILKIFMLQCILLH